jgi:uncharacterized membrane protein YoaK (UPF0700 family)
MRIILALILVLVAVYVAEAQRSQPKELPGYLVVATCGTLPAPAYVAGSYAAATIDVTGKLCVNQ